MTTFDAVEGLCRTLYCSSVEVDINLWLYSGEKSVYLKRDTRSVLIFSSEAFRPVGPRANDVFVCLWDSARTRWMAVCASDRDIRRMIQCVLIELQSNSHVKS